MERNYSPPFMESISMSFRSLSGLGSLAPLSLPLSFPFPFSSGRLCQLVTTTPERSMSNLISVPKKIAMEIPITRTLPAMLASSVILSYMTPSKESKLSYSVMLKPGPEPQPPQRRRRRNRRLLVTRTKNLRTTVFSSSAGASSCGTAGSSTGVCATPFQNEHFASAFPQLEAESRRIPANLFLTQLQKYYLREAPAISQGTHKMLPCHDLRHCIKFVQP